MARRHLEAAIQASQELELEGEFLYFNVSLILMAIACLSSLMKYLNPPFSFFYSRVLAT